MSNQKGTLIKSVWKSKWCYAAIFPSIAFLCVFNLYPAFSGIVRSLFRWKTKNYFNPVFCGFDNYERLFQDEAFWQSFGILMIFLIVGHITSFGVNLPVTYLIFRLKNTKMGKFFQRAFVIPMMIPGMVTSMYWRFFYQHGSGILDSILTFFGREDLIRVWLADGKLTLPAVLLIGFPFAGGFTMLILLSGLLNADGNLEEAAVLDGANSWNLFTRIYVPMIIPQYKILTVLGMIAGIQSYGTQIMYTNGNYGTMVPAYYMYKSAFVNGNYGYATAQGVVLFVIILVVTILQQKLINTND